MGLTRAIPFLGIFVLNCRYCVFAVLIAESFDAKKHVSFVSVGGGGVRVEQGHLRPLCPAQRPGPCRVLCSLVRTLQGMDVAKKIINKKTIFHK